MRSASRIQFCNGHSHQERKVNDGYSTDSERSVQQNGFGQHEDLLASSTLVYLFADKFAPENTVVVQLKNFTTPGIRAPIGDSEVATAPLADTILAVAFWGLQRQGAIRLEVVPTSWLFGLRKGFELKITIDDTRERSGLEGELMRVLGEHPGEAMREIVYWWFGARVSDLWQIVVDKEREKAMRAGYLTPGSGKDAQPQPNRDRIATLQTSAGELIREWDAFKTSDAQLFQSL